MKKLRLRWAGVCQDCGVDVPARTEAWWNASGGSVHCVACVASSNDTDTPADTDTVAEAKPDEPDNTGEGAPEAAVPDDDSVGGRSARQMFERRTERHDREQAERITADQAWREEAVAARPVLGRLSTALTPKPKRTAPPQSTTAWKVGAEGEERVAEVLREVPGVAVLHDRQVPGSRANIDHLVVGPGGVFVIDAKKYVDQEIEVRDVGSFFRPDLRLYVGGRNRTKLVEGVEKQVEIVRTALGPELADVPVRGVLCFVGSVWGRRLRTKTVRSVVAVWPLGLPDLVAASGPLREAVEDIAGVLRARLKPA